MENKIELESEITFSEAIKEAKAAFPGYEVATACEFYSRVLIQITKYTTDERSLLRAIKKLNFLQLLKVGLN